MPLYEYRCAKCNKVFETLQKFSDKPLKKHPDCGGKVERLISTSGLQFKGSGWYVNDYARAGSKGGEAKAEAKSESTESKSETKSESKTETKSESKSESKTDSKPAKAS